MTVEKKNTILIFNVFFGLGLFYSFSVPLFRGVSLGCVFSSVVTRMNGAHCLCLCL